MMTLFLIFGLSALAGAETNSSAPKIEELRSKQAAAIQKAETSHDEAKSVESSVASATSSGKEEELAALDAIAEALALAEQGFRHAATLYDAAAQNYGEGKDDMGSTNALLAESAEECAEQVRQKALDAKTLCANERYQAALEEAQAASQQGQLCNAYAEAGGEEEAGAGPGEQAPISITPPVKTSVDNPLDDTRNTETASGF
jgi:hypothetical protein